MKTVIPTTYTNTRIRKEYLDKLQALAEREKRSAMKQLEVLIDAAMTPIHQSSQGERDHGAPLGRDRITGEH